MALTLIENLLKKKVEEIPSAWSIQIVFMECTLTERVEGDYSDVIEKSSDIIKSKTDEGLHLIATSFIKQS